MKCPFCGAVEDKVIDSRSVKEETVIRRRRECVLCTRRFTTYERIEETMPLVIKKNGERQPFDRNKVKKGIVTSCIKRNISSIQIEEVVKSVEQTIQEMESKEIDSFVIGKEVMKSLQKTDEVAYVRFASVYKDFSTVDDFITQVEELEGKKPEK